MAFSMMKLVQVLYQRLAIFNSFLSFGKRRRCSETTLVVEIPDDLVEEILYRLSVKDLLRWKSVSKGWKSLIMSGHLAEKHVHFRKKKYGAEELKITVEGSISRGLHVKFFSKHSGSRSNNNESEDIPRVPGSCNGLVCVYDSVYVYLINPLTCMSRTLAPPGGTKISVGFGEDVVTGTYKVAVLYGFDNCDNTVETVIFDLSTSQWRLRYKTAGPIPLSFTLITPKRNPVFVNGSLFWLLAQQHSEILVLDLHTEKFRTVLKPNDIDFSLGRIYMWSLEDRLCVSDVRQKLDSDVWVLVQDGLSERWERTRFPPTDAVIPPLKSNSVLFIQSLLSPYQSSSSDTYLL